jgi:putative ABC transport system permease protein
MHCDMNKHLETIIGAAIHSFSKNKMRSFLTVFGIMIGIGMVIIVLSAGNGVKGIILDEISSFGDNWINIEIKVPSTGRNSVDNARSIGQGVNITTMTLADKDAIERTPGITNAYAGMTSQAVIAYGTEKLRPTIFGVSASYIDINKSDVDQGRFYSAADDQSGAQVIVLGSKIADSLFGNARPVGKRVKVDGKSYQVIGVMESLGATGFFDMDSIVYIPVRTVQKKILGVDHVMWIVAQMDSNKNAEGIAEELRWIIRDQHSITNPDKDDFAVTTQEESLEVVGTIILGITWLLIGLSAISLLVGGVGIMNVMYVSVAERTFEIGLRKSVGATKKDILQQFLIEAIVITGIGGVVGIIFGIIISFLISVGAQLAGFAWPFKISILSVILSVSFSTAVGLLFGLYPAKKAAELNPIEALLAE